MWSSTSTPRSQSRPAARAKPVEGRMPAAMTTMSALTLVPSSSSMPATFPSRPWIALVLAPVRMVWPRRSSSVLSR
jgi:hypothetical protein